MVYIAAVIVLTLTVISDSQGTVWFSRDGVCVAAAPCSCGWQMMKCDGLQLRAMPTFIPRDLSNDSLTGVPMNGATFLMSSNNIEVIGDRAFCNLTFALSTRVYLVLDSNAISSLADDAFDCIQDNVRALYLKNNRLTELPLALLKLRNLTDLFLQNNPLVHLNPLVMKQLGPSLTNLQLDLGRFSTWPSFSHLSVLYSLEANNITFPSIPEDGFSGFNASINRIQFINSRLTSLPRSFCLMPLLRDSRVEVFEPMDLKNILPCVNKVEITVNKANGLLEYFILTKLGNKTLTDIESHRLELARRRAIRNKGAH